MQTAGLFAVIALNYEAASRFEFASALRAFRQVIHVYMAIKVNNHLQPWSCIVFVLVLCIYFRWGSGA
jgi:hypothetical protein